MVELRVFVEGWGERGFVQEILGPHLASFGIHAQAAWMGSSRKKSGGIRTWNGRTGARNDLRRAILQISPSYKLYVTTMVDYYGLPSDWPNRDTASSQPKPQRSPEVESGMWADMREALGNDWRIQRFIPYISLHELDALILSKPEAFSAEFPGHEREIEGLKDVLRGVPPEDIDDGANTAPSKRIEQVLPAYAQRKGIAAVNTLRKIDIDHLRTTCPHFGRWLCCLESLGNAV